mgnify:CR=1 FL=1
MLASLFSSRKEDLAPLQVDTQVDILMASGAGRLVPADLANGRVILLRPSLLYVVVDHAPEPGIMLVQFSYIRATPIEIDHAPKQVKGRVWPFLPHLALAGLTTNS